MTEQWENSDGLQDLAGRLKRLDIEIPVPESAKAPQLLARMERLAEQGERPVLRVVRTRWLKAAGMAAAFVIIFGSFWLGRSWGGISHGTGTAESSSMAAAGAEPMAAAQVVPKSAPAAIEMEEKRTADVTASYAEVRERLVALQSEDAYYTAHESAMPDAGEAGGAGGAMGGALNDGKNGAGAAPSTRAAAAPRAFSGALSTDIARTDGDTLYYLMVPVGEKDPVVKIVDMTDLSVTSTIKITNAGEVSNLFVENGMLAVLYSDENFYTLPIYERQVEKEPVRSGVATVSATVLEIYDVSDGANPASTRKLEQQGDYVAAQLDGGVLSLVTDCRLLTNARNTAAKDEELVPALRDSAVSNEVTPIPAGGICLPEGATEDRYAVISLVKLADTAQPAQTKAVLGGASAVYRSGTGLYVAGAFAGEGKTGILKFTQSGDAVALTAQGSVPGIVESAEAMNEQGGKLRIVAALAGEAGLYTLDGGTLSQTGALALPTKPEALCYTEKTLYWTDATGAVQAVGFAGGEAVRDATGAAAQLYALPEGGALALGYDAQKNLEAALYDAAGKRLGAVILGGRGSITSAPQAPLNMKNGLLALPVLLYGAENSDVFNGFVLLSIGADGLTERGRAGTTSGMAENDVYAKGLDARHCIVTDNGIITVSRGQLTSSELTGLERKRIEL